MCEQHVTTLPTVAIAGCGVITAVGKGVDALLAALCANASGLRVSEKFNSPRFQSNIVGAIPTEGWARNNGEQDSFQGAATSISRYAPSNGTDNPAWYLANEAVRQARTEAFTVLNSISPDRIGLILSTTKANIEALERLSENRPCSDSARRHLQGNLLANDLATKYGLRGPVQCVCTACVSGLIAIQQGAKIIQRDAADAVFVVGVDHLSAFVMAGFTTFKAMDPSGCRPFDRDRCGLTPGEAGAAIVLARADKIQGRAVIIRGWGVSNDANHPTGPARDGSGLERAIRLALASAKLQSGDIDYVNAHGTATLYNDAMESRALWAVFGTACPAVSGLKGMLGHTLGAAGIAETIACTLALREQFLPGTPRLNALAGDMPANIVREPRPAAKLDHILKLNSGFGGVNSALILTNG